MIKRTLGWITMLFLTSLHVSRVAWKPACGRGLPYLHHRHFLHLGKNHFKRLQGCFSRRATQGRHLSRMLHVGLLQSLLPLPRVGMKLHHWSRQDRTAFFCWLNNKRWVSTSGWLGRSLAADGGVGMRINRLAGRLTDGIYRTPRRPRIHFSGGTCTCQVHSSW